MYIGISSIVQALKDSQGSLAQKGMLQDTAFAVSSIVLSALQLAMVGEGASVPSVSANCNQKVSFNYTDCRSSHVHEITFFVY